MRDRSFAVRRIAVTVAIMALLLAAALAIGASVAIAQCGGEISLGRPITGSIDQVGQFCQYIFVGSQGDLVSVSMDTQTSSLDPFLELVDPGGYVVAFDDDGDGGPNSLIRDYRLGRSGTYTIRARSYNNGGSGTFDLWPRKGSGFIRNQLSGKCIDVKGNPARNNGDVLQLWDCEFGARPADTDQRWEITPDGLIRNQLSGKCIDVKGNPARNNGAVLQLWDCESGRRPADTDQRWEIRSDGFIRNQLSGKCIDVKGNPARNNGAVLQLWDCEFGARPADSDQRWMVE
jgi:hypothetical protein